VNISSYTEFDSEQALFEHFESELKPGMTMSNYGTYWSVAHRIPKVYYDFSDIEEVVRCNSKANLGCDYEVWNNPIGERPNSSKGGSMPSLEELYSVGTPSWPKLFGDHMTDPKRIALCRHHW
jgi:hypothetical protein